MIKRIESQLKNMEKRKINELGKILTGKTPSTKNKIFYGNKYPFITPTDINSFDIRYLNKTQRFLSEDGYKKQKQNILPKDTICVVCIGSTVGKICMTNTFSFTNQQLNSIIPNKRVVKPLFLYYKLRGIAPIIKNIADGRGSGVPIINKSEFENIELEVPPLHIQKEIQEILSPFDDLIEINNQKIEILENVIKLFHQEYIQDLKYEKSSLIKVSERLGDITEQKRTSVNPDKIDPFTSYLGLADLPSNSISLVKWDKAKNAKSSKYLFEKFDILFGKIRPYLHKVVFAPIKGICSTDIIIIIPKEKKYYPLILTTVSSTDFIKHATASSKGTKMPRADWNVLKNYQIIIPTEEILSNFNKNINTILKNIQILIMQNFYLRRIRDLLISKIF